MLWPYQEIPQPQHHQIVHIDEGTVDKGEGAAEVVADKGEGPADPSEYIENQNQGQQLMVDNMRCQWCLIVA